MKRFLFILTCLISLSSCVSKSKYEDLEHENMILKSSIYDLENEVSRLEYKVSNLKDEVSNLEYNIEEMEDIIYRAKSMCIISHDNAFMVLNILNEY